MHIVMFAIERKRAFLSAPSPQPNINEEHNGQKANSDYRTERSCLRDDFEISQDVCFPIHSY